MGGGDGGIMNYNYNHPENEQIIYRDHSILHVIYVMINHLERELNI